MDSPSQSPNGDSSPFGGALDGAYSAGWFIIENAVSPSQSPSVTALPEGEPWDGENHAVVDKGKGVMWRQFYS